MLQNWFILLPELCMLAFFLVAWPVDLFRREKTAKTFFTLAQFFLLAVICFTILFYNKSVFPRYWQNTPLTTLFKTFVYLLSWAWFYLSSKWFLTKNRPSFKFYAICFMLLFGFDILASASSLLTLGLAVPFVCAGCVKSTSYTWPSNESMMRRTLLSISEDRKNSRNALMYTSSPVSASASGVSIRANRTKQFPRVARNSMRSKDSLSSSFRIPAMYPNRIELAFSTHQTSTNAGDPSCCTCLGEEQSARPSFCCSFL